jgi:hypothetical protein
MITITQGRGNAARRMAIVIVVAGLLGVAVPARADTTHGARSGTVCLETPNGALEYPNPQYPNHKPLRDNYPGTTPAPHPRPRHDPATVSTGRPPVSARRERWVSSCCSPRVGPPPESREIAGTGSHS